MKRTVYRWFWVWDFEKEERWLNEMSARGQQLVGVGWCRFVFEEETGTVYRHRLQLMKGHLDSAERDAYIRFLEETGAEHIGNMLRWSFFRKPAAQGEFELFSDLDSKIGHLNSIMGMIFPIWLLNLGLGISNFSRALNDAESVLQPQGLLAFLCAAAWLLLSYCLLRLAHMNAKLKKEKWIRE